MDIVKAQQHPSFHAVQTNKTKETEKEKNYHIKAHTNLHNMFQNMKDFFLIFHPPKIEFLLAAKPHDHFANQSIITSLRFFVMPKQNTNRNSL